MGLVLSTGPRRRYAALWQGKLTGHGIEYGCSALEYGRKPQCVGEAVGMRLYADILSNERSE